MIGYMLISSTFNPIIFQHQALLIFMTIPFETSRRSHEWKITELSLAQSWTRWKYTAANAYQPSRNHDAITKCTFSSLNYHVMTNKMFLAYLSFFCARESIISIQSIFNHSEYLWHSLQLTNIQS